MNGEICLNIYYVLLIFKLKLFFIYFIKIKKVMIIISNSRYTV